MAQQDVTQAGPSPSGPGCGPRSGVACCLVLYPSALPASQAGENDSGLNRHALKTGPASLCYCSLLLGSPLAVQCELDPCPSRGASY